MRRMNDGNVTGVKQDRYRHSHLDPDYEVRRARGVSRSTSNTLGGITAENRGRRGDDPRSKDFNDENPFENGGRLTNWGNRKGWDHYFYGKSFREGRQGGSWMGPDFDSRHYGKGPKGWKRSDDNIYEDVCDILLHSPNVDASDIGVEVKNGCVYLNGTVDDRQSKRLAELEIENVSGVQDVQNLLTLNRGDAYVSEL